MIAFISMLMTFKEANEDSCADKIGTIEAIAALVKVVLEHAANRLLFIHCCLYGKVAPIDGNGSAFFPNQTAQTPTCLATPVRHLPLSRVSDFEWCPFRCLVAPGFKAMEELQAWILDNYSPEIHDDIFAICSDCLLLLETVADMCYIPLQTWMVLIAVVVPIEGR